MSVFLRWGIFGILGFAGLMYAYNASKHIAEKRAERATTVAVTAQPAPAAGPRVAEPPTPAPKPPTATPQCEAELVVAQRALDARHDGDPLDRLLRIQEIAFQDPVRRARLEKVATRWFTLTGAEPIPDALRAAVLSDCVRSSSAP
ncbi:MAG: hypothetical protein ABI769_17235 [Pseudomonadota bacterium]